MARNKLYFFSRILHILKGTVSYFVIKTFEKWNLNISGQTINIGKYVVTTIPDVRLKPYRDF